MAAWRARRHGLEERRPADELLDVVSRLCGLHAQVMSSAELTAWARLDDLGRDAVATALWEDRTLVKTWAMRGTLHLLAAADFGLWQAVIGTDDRHLKPSWQKAFGPSPEELDRLCDDIARALEGRELLREELAAAVATEAGDADLAEALRASWGALLKPAAFRGRLCFAPGEGQKVRFTNPATWLGEWERWDADAALAEAARRYLGVHGPATREEFARWLAKSPAVGGKIIAALGDEAVSVDVDGEPHWALAANVDELVAAEPTSTVRLLPAFDQYVIAATRHAERLMPGPHKRRVYRDQGWLTPVVCVGGRIEGVWRWERKGKRLEVTIEPFAKLAVAARRAADAETERLATFLGGELAVRWA